MELINYHLFVDFIVPLFEKKTFDQYLIILLICSLANVILKKVWGKLITMKERKEKQERNTQLQKEEYQDRKLSEMAMSAAEQIQLQVDRSLEPKLEVLLAKKIRPTALKSKPSKKEQHYKFSSQTSKTKEQFEKMETRQREHPDNSEFILALT